MSVHYIHDLGREPLVEPYAPVEAACGAELREAHEVVAPESESEVCPECLRWSRLNRYQNRRCAVEMGAAAAASAAEKSGRAARARPPISAETDA